jgi:hypothetical protein
MGVMRALVGEEMLTAWERSRELREQEAALALLALGWPERSINEFATLPLGERNALLLELRAVTLGQHMEGFAICPACGVDLEFTLDARELAEGVRAQAPGQPEEIAGYTMRPANTLDLLAGSAAENEEQARSILLARTLGVKNAELNSQDEFDPGVRTHQWLGSQPESVTAVLFERFEQMNASAEIRVQLHCAQCKSCPSLDLDIGRFFLREIASSARRLLTDIHELASAYGWSEQSILAMSAVRRAAYLEMLGS